jgi:hypothetical protein
MKVLPPPGTGKKYTMLSLAFKQFIVKESEETFNIRATSRKYCVQLSQIRQWKIAIDNTNDNDNNMVSNQQTNCLQFGVGGRKALLPESFTNKVKVWLEEQQSSILVVSLMLIRD